jgi:methylenetetrahydrofolate reductase (NADPH)
VHLASAGAEPVLCLLTRDLNRIALQASILGAVSMGVKNVLCLSGRHQALTSCVSAKGVFDIDQVQLVRLADSLRREGKLSDGRGIGSPLPLVIGADANPFSDPIELQALAAEKAIAAGADFVITCPVFNLDRLNAWVSHLRERGLTDKACIIASVMPLTSAKEAVSLAEKYCHLDIGDDVVLRLDSAQDKRSAGVHLAAETIAYLKTVAGIRGVHIAAGDDYELAADVISAAGLTRS